MQLLTMNVMTNGVRGDNTSEEIRFNNLASEYNGNMVFDVLPVKWDANTPNRKLIVSPAEAIQLIGLLSRGLQNLKVGE